MPFIDTLKSFFSTTQNKKSQLLTEQYSGYIITAEPLLEGGQYRIHGTITQGELSHTFIRADQLPSEELCEQETLRKAKLLIDQQGNNLFE
jgi:hypothetical protein